MAATALAALIFSLSLLYAMGCALIARNAYQAMSLRREIDDLRAQIALSRYQINLDESSSRLQQAAAKMSMRFADPVQEVDYVLLPSSEEAGAQVGAAPGEQTRAGLAGVLAQLAMEVVTSAGGRAEASTSGGHRR